MRERLDDPDLSVRRAVAYALAHQATLESLDSVLQSVNDDDPQVREGCVDAVKCIEGGDPRRTAALSRALRDANVRVQAASILAELGPVARDAVPLLIEAPEGPDRELRRVAAGVLARMGPVAVGAIPALREAAESGDPGTRSAALTALSKIEPGGDLPAK